MQQYEAGKFPTIVKTNKGYHLAPEFSELLGTFGSEAMYLLNGTPEVNGVPHSYTYFRNSTIVPHGEKVLGVYAHNTLPFSIEQSEEGERMVIGKTASDAVLSIIIANGEKQVTGPEAENLTRTLYN